MGTHYERLRSEQETPCSEEAVTAKVKGWSTAPYRKTCTNGVVNLKLIT